jgi:hypothetical protein
MLLLTTLYPFTGATLSIYNILLIIVGLSVVLVLLGFVLPVLFIPAALGLLSVLVIAFSLLKEYLTTAQKNEKRAITHPFAIAGSILSIVGMLVLFFGWTLFITQLIGLFLLAAAAALGGLALFKILHKPEKFKGLFWVLLALLPFIAFIGYVGIYFR